MNRHPDQRHGNHTLEMGMFCTDMQPRCATLPARAAEDSGHACVPFIAICIMVIKVDS